MQMRRFKIKSNLSYEPITTTIVFKLFVVPPNSLLYFFAFNPTASNLAFTVCSSGVQNIIRYFLATHYSTSSHNFFRVRKNSKLWGDRQVMGWCGKLWAPTMISENWSHFSWFFRLFGVGKSISGIFVCTKWREKEIRRRNRKEKRNRQAKMTSFFSNWINLDNLFRIKFFPPSYFSETSWNHSRSS